MVPVVVGTPGIGGSAQARVVAVVHSGQPDLAVALERALRRHHFGPVIAIDLRESGVPEVLEQAAVVLFAHDLCRSLHGIRCLERLRSSQPQLPLFCCADTPRAGNALIARLARAGCDRVFLDSIGEGPAEIALAITRVASHTLPSGLVRQLLDAVPDDVRHLVSWTLRSAWRPMCRGDIARFFSKHPTAVSRQLQRTGAPSVRTITRLCMGAHLSVELDLTHHTEAVIAERLGLGGDNAVRMLATRSLGASVSELRGLATEYLRERWRAAFCSC
jgi:hypothetical protein